MEAAQRIDWQTVLSQRALSRGDAELTAILAAAPPGVLSAAGGFPNPATFPSAVLDEIVTRLVTDDPGVALQYTPTEGLASFREYLRDRQLALQGRRPEPDELIVTSGGMECIDLVCRSLVDPGDTVVIEAPCYLGAITAFAGYEAELVGIAMDEHGMQVDALAERLDGGLRPTLVYTIPEYQNPSGQTMPLARRQQLVELCRRHGVPILEDVAYREISYDGTSEPTLWSLAPELVVQAGTFSKIFSPGVRLGWAVGPAELIAQLAAGKQNTDQCSGALGQRMVEEYGRGGHFERGIPRSCALYASHWRATEQALERHMPEGTSWSVPTGGFFTWITFPESVDTVALRGPAREAGVSFVPGRPFYVEDLGRNALRFSFSHLDEHDLDEAVARLGSAVRG